MGSSINPKSKERLDILLVDQGFAESIAKARALIMSGNVLVDELRVEKPGTLVKTDSVLRLKNQPPKYVGRGGEKLEGALDYFGLDPKDSIALDLGSSTGGFSDCLLQRGARKVYAVDVGTNQLNFGLRQDDRVVDYENTHAKDLVPCMFEVKPDLLVADVSFISLSKVLPWAIRVLDSNFHAVVLVKPQFELDRSKVLKGGVVKDETLEQEAVSSVKKMVLELGCKVIGVQKSVLTGSKKGNQEYFLLFSNGTKCSNS